jgi:hypothetical protein
MRGLGFRVGRGRRRYGVGAGVENHGTTFSFWSYGAFLLHESSANRPIMGRFQDGKR